MKNTTFGQRGGVGPTRGRTATTYEFKFPDGTSGTKRSFFVATPTAVIAIYNHGGKWFAAGCFATLEDLHARIGPGGVTVEARKKEDGTQGSDVPAAQKGR